MSRAFLALAAVIGPGVFAPAAIAQTADESGNPPKLNNARPADRPALLLIDDSARPTVQATWRSSGREIFHAEPRPFAAPDDAQPLGDANLAASVSLGGTRLEVGAGHPRGAILRVEVRKVETNRALFPGVEPGSAFRLEVRGVRFNQPVRVDPETALVHLRYALKDVEACSLPPSAVNQFLLANPSDTLGGMVAAGVNATPGGLSGEPRTGTVDARVEPDGTVTFGVEIPYAMLRHLQDPWASGLPGTFFEPIRLHAEIEVLPEWAEPIVRVHPPLDKPYERPTLED